MHRNRSTQINMKAKLKNITTTQSGIYEKNHPDGDILYLQVSDFKNGKELNNELKPAIINNERVEKFILQDKDLLFAAKGTSNFCVMYRLGKEKAVASSSFFVIRILNNNIDPEYICWFLNNPQTLNYLKAHAVGTSIPSITKTMLEDLEISIIPLEKQRMIVAYHNLQNREVELHTLIAQKKRLLTDHILYNVTNKTK